MLMSHNTCCAAAPHTFKGLGSFRRRHLLRRALATAFFASPWSKAKCILRTMLIACSICYG